MRIEVTSTAERQILAARRWWNRNRPKAPGAFVSELRDALELLRQHPEAGRSIEDPRFADIRRLSLNRTRYFLFYELKRDVVVIRAIRHQSRDPRA